MTSNVKKIGICIDPSIAERVDIERKLTKRSSFINAILKQYFERIDSRKGILGENRV